MAEDIQHSKSHRWNWRGDEVCKGYHDKSQPCEYQQATAYELGLRDGEAKTPSESIEHLRNALRGLGKEKQFRGELCWCDTIDGNYCVSQPQCVVARDALSRAEKKQAQLTQEVRSGVWRHYAGKYYLVHGVGKHTETGEWFVSYTPLYVHPKGGPPLQFRPLSMWLEKVQVGKEERVQRFIFVGDQLPKGAENAE